jgi:fucose 4-O-acetylase-like acetyltransferase
MTTREKAHASVHLASVLARIVAKMQKLENTLANVHLVRVRAKVAQSKPYRTLVLLVVHSAVFRVFPRSWAPALQRALCRNA